MAKKERVTKLEAARRQLRTAIELWFAEKDIVSIHTLAFASYELIHTLTRGKRKRDLLFDTVLVDETRRKQWAMFLKKDASFFKHADKDGNASTDLDPAISETLMFFSVLGIYASGEPISDVELAFNAWYIISNPKIASDPRIKQVMETAGVEPEKVIDIRKGNFLNEFLNVRMKGRGRR